MRRIPTTKLIEYREMKRAITTFPTVDELQTTHKITPLVAEQVSLFLAGKVTRKEVAPILTNMVQWIRFCQVTDKELKDACERGVKHDTLVAVCKSHEQLRKNLPERFPKPCECYYCKLAR